MLTLERDDAYEEERKPHAGVRTNNAHIMTLGTDTSDWVNDTALVLETKKEGEKEKHDRPGSSRLCSVFSPHAWMTAVGIKPGTWLGSAWFA